jgi:hypothetical protein
MRFSNAGFFMKHFPRAPKYPHLDYERKFKELFSILCLSPVSTTPVIGCSPVSTTSAINYHQCHC